jgi:hypothetical protein
MKPLKRTQAAAYDDLLADVAGVIEDARRAAARSVNTVTTTTYWLTLRWDRSMNPRPFAPLGKCFNIPFFG